MIRQVFHCLLAAVIALLLLCIESTSEAASINVDFGPHPTAYTGTAAAPDSGTHWNRVSNNSPIVTSLADSSGTATGVGVVFDVSSHGITMIDWTAPQVAPNLMRDYLYAVFPAVDRLWITGLDSDVGYDLYLYSQNGADSRGGTRFTVNGAVQTVKYPADSPNFVRSEPASHEYGNYLRYLNIKPDANGRIEILYTDAMGFSAAFNGFQLLTHVVADFDGDRDVDGDDLDVWKSLYGGPGADADGDGDSDGRDFLIWQRHYGMGVNLLHSPVMAVPEPGLPGLCFLFVILGLAPIVRFEFMRPLAISLSGSLFLVIFSQLTIAVTVNVDFGTYPIPHSGTAVAPDTGILWNQVATTPTAGPLFDSFGRLTTFGVEIENYGLMAEWTAPQVAPNLMRDYLYAFNAGGDPYPMRITGLDPLKQYDLYLYSKNGAEGAATGSTTRFIVNNSEKVVTNTGNHASFILGDNYTVFNSLHPAADGSLFVQYLDLKGVGASFNGFQLVDNSSSEVPSLTVGRGRQLMLQRGLQIQAFELTPTFDFDVDQWMTANFTGINFAFDGNVMHPLLLSRLPPNHQWGRWYGGMDVTPEEMPYVGNLVSLQYWDELDGSFGKADLMEILPEVEAKYREWNAQFPDTLVMTTTYGGHLNLDNLRTYMRTTKPDILNYDFYPGFYATRESWYTEMQKFRTVALEGYDGTGKEPIPYGQILQGFRTSYSEQLPGEAFVRQQQFTSWAFGFTFLSQWLYRDPLVLTAPGNEGMVAQMFGSRGHHNPTVMFDYVAETNRQSRNLGPALVRIASTDVRIITGRKDGQANPSVPGVPTWQHGTQNTAGYTDHLTSIVPLGKDPLHPDFNNHSDVIVGYFRPLLEDNTDNTFVDGLTFMIVNGNAGDTVVRDVNGYPFNAMGFNIPVDAHGNPDPIVVAANTAEALGEWYRLTFDFSGSNFDSLARLSRETGEVELVPLSSSGGSTYYLDLYLPGGTGDLFTYWDSTQPLPSIAALSTVPEPTTILLGSLFVGFWPLVGPRKRTKL